MMAQPYEGFSDSAVPAYALSSASSTPVAMASVVEVDAFSSEFDFSVE